MKTCSYKVTVQTLYCKLGEEKLDDNFYTLSAFLNVEATFVFFHSEGDLPERK